MRKRSRMRGGTGKERAIMLAASVFVLGALTLTGVYVKENSTEKSDDGYSVDLSSLKNDNTVQEEAEGLQKDENISLSVQNPNAEYELDLEAVLEEGELENTETAKKEKAETKEESSRETAETETNSEDTKETDMDSKAQDVENSTSVSAATWKALEFTEETGLIWPTAGEILINYSMDQTIYFPTLAQYKYNPAIVIAAAQGKTIVAAADAQIADIYTDSEIGNVVKMDLGNGYEMLYGQLTDIQVSKGAYVSAGDVIGAVAEPTKYYSVEGSNLYVKLTKDGEPVNPLTLLPQ